jgi:hypothetical protein
MKLSNVGLSVFIVLCWTNISGSQYCFSQNNVVQHDIEYLGHSLIGKRLDDAVQMLGIDTGKISILEDPPFILNGIEVNQGDSCNITLFIDRTSKFEKTYKKPKTSDYSLICRKKIRSIYWSKPQSKKDRRIKK